MKYSTILVLSFACLAICAQCHGGKRFDPLTELLKARRTKTSPSYGTTKDVSVSDSDEYRPVYVGAQEGLKEADMILSLPGQPQVNFSQYSGYVTVDPNAGRALFYYFAESGQAALNKPLVLWLSGGTCSSLAGAMTELGPFRVNPDGKTLWDNEYSWNNVANVIFLESPAGVGFFYSNTSSDYMTNGDTRTAQDAYTFLVNWLERFPEYKTRDFYITGECYTGHYAPQLASLIMQNNKVTNQTVINLKGIAIGNAMIDEEGDDRGHYEYIWTHALISDETYQGIIQNCNFTFGGNDTDTDMCSKYIIEADETVEDVFPYNIYAPWCSENSSSMAGVYDQCSGEYVDVYLNTPQVQTALHANVTNIPGPWTDCSSKIKTWTDSEETILPKIKALMADGLRVWIYSGDTDSIVPITSTRYSIGKLEMPVKTPWYPWYFQEEVGGYAVEYANVTMVTVRGAGLFVPSYQPGRALALFTSFLEGKLPPSN